VGQKLRKDSKAQGLQPLGFLLRRGSQHVILSLLEKWAANFNAIFWPPGNHALCRFARRIGYDGGMVSEIQCRLCGVTTTIEVVTTTPNYRSKKSKHGVIVGAEQCSTNHLLQCHACGRIFTVVTGLGISLAKKSQD
jgi:hypothetical protein